MTVEQLDVFERFLDCFGSNWQREIEHRWMHGVIEDFTGSVKHDGSIIYRMRSSSDRVSLSILKRLGDQIESV